MLAERRRLVSLPGGRELAAAFVSGNYFELLRPRMALGRALAGFDARASGVEAVTVLSHQAWMRLFEGDPSAVGRTIELNGRPFLIVGVAAPEFVGLDEYPRDLWLPLTMHAAIAGSDLVAPGAARELGLTARLRAGVTAAHAAAALTPVMAGILDRGDAVRAGLEPQATPAPLTWQVLAVLSPLFAMFGLVLAAACANVSNMMLARANARHREIGVRLSLGASRGRVVRQLLTEGLLVSALACLLALALAAAFLRIGVSIFLATLPPSMADLIRVMPLGFDQRVFLFALAVTAAVTLMFALVPALQCTRLSLTHALRGEAGPAVGASTLRGLLVVSQVAVSLVLIVVAATLARNRAAVGAADLGFATDGVLSVNQRIEGPSIAGRAAALLSADPSVAAVAATSRNPLFGELPKTPAWGADRRAIVPVSYQFVSPEYFEMLRIPIARGRGFRDDEARAEAPVGIINASGARALWGGADPIGRTVRVRFFRPEAGADEVRRLDRLPGPDEPDTSAIEVTIVGVARDVVSTFVYVGPDPAHLYLPTSPGGSRAEALLVRGTAGLRIDELRTLLQRAHANPQALEVLALEDMRRLQMYPLQAASWIGALLGVVALALSVSGLYGVLSYTIGQRVREIGIRMALGATAVAVVRLVAAQSARLVAIGGLIGLAASFSALMALSALLVRLRTVSLLDRGAFVIAIGLVAAAAAAAAWWPARRAARIVPAVTLRADG